VSLEAGGAPVTGRAGQRHRLALLALVAAAPAGLSRDRLISLLWPEAEPDRARHLLSHSIYILRQVLGEDALLVSSDAVRLNSEVVWCDVQQFERALGAGDYARAVELYPGPFLDGFYLADNVEFERWVDSERERLGQAYARALQILASERESAGDSSAAILWWRRLAAYDPHNSRTVIRLVRALERAGDVAGALRVALAHEALLREDLGIGPPAEVVDELERLRREHPGRATEIATILPAQPLEPITVRSTATAPMTIVPIRRRFPWLRWWQLPAAAAIMVALALSAIVLRRSRAGTPLDANLLAVAPFEALGGELELWSEGLVDLLSRNLDGAGSLRTVAPSVVIQRWKGRADPATASVLARRTGAGLIVFGNLVAMGPDSVRLTATIWDAARGRTIGEAQLRGDTQHMGQLADSLTASLLGELGQTRDVMAVRSASLRATSLPALKAFLEGERLFRQGAWNSAQAAYRRALAHDSTLVPALRHLAWSVGWGSPADYALSQAYFLRAGELNHGLTQRESLLVTDDSLSAAISQPDRVPVGSLSPMRRRMFATLEDAVRLYPDDPEIWYQLGEARYHFGWEERVSRAQVLRAFERSIALDSSFAPAYEHTTALGLTLYGLAGWDRYARPYLARRSTEDVGSATRFLDGLLKQPPAQAGYTDSVIRSATLEQLFGAMLTAWEFPDSLETVVRLGRGLAATEARGAQHHHDPLFRRQLLAAALAYRGHLGEAQSLIESGVMVGTIPSVPAGIVLLGSSHPDSVDSTFERWLRGGSVWPPGDWPQGGPPGSLAWALPWWSARRDTLALAEYARRADSVQRTTARSSWKENARYLAGAARAYAVLARGDTAAALAFFQRPHAISYPWARVTEGQILSRQGRYEDALELFEEAYPMPQWWGPTKVLAKLEAARTAERLGQVKRAAAHYRFVVDVWRHADPELEPYVREARAGLERLAAEG
jgi:DNA-binding SARP family transcriptional activator